MPCCVGLPGLSILVLSWSVPCSAVPCPVVRRCVVCGLWSLFEIYDVSRQSSTLQMVQGREIDEADLRSRMPRYLGTYDWKR